LALEADDISVLYREHARALLVYCARRTYDADIALDLVAETFAVAFEQRASCQADEAEGRAAWLYGIARHLVAGFWRRGAAEQRAVRRLGVELRDLSAEERERVEELADLQAGRRDVAARLGRLGDEQREAIRLRVVEEYDYAEIANRLAVSEQVVRARVSRGLRRLALDVAEASHA
jgi:RNA polymerase sigma-70 factor (ECF subfamily)